MACTITRPDPQALFDRLRGMFSAEVLKGSPIIPESNEWYVTSLNYAMMEEFFSYADQLAKEIDPSTACCENLYKIAARDGVYPLSAKGSVGYGEITGTAGSRLPSTFSVLIGEEQYDCISDMPAKLPASGSLTVRLRSTTTGAATNNFTGSDITGTLTNAIAGVDSKVTIKGGSFCGGADAETCETFRERYLARRSYAPRFRARDLEDIIMSWPCVTRVCAQGEACCLRSENCGCKDGCSNSRKYYVFFDGTFTDGIAPQCVIDEMNTWLFGTNPGFGEGEADIGVCGEIMTPTAVPVSVSITGLGCYGDTLLSKVQTRVEDFFKTLCPDGVLSIRSVEAVILQLYGRDVDFTVTLTPDSTDNCTVTTCGDVEFNCGYMPTLKCVSFVDFNSDGC